MKKSSHSSIILAVLAVLIASADRGDARSLDWSETFMDGRIVGGEETSIVDVPYQVSLQIKGSHYCGGSIIGKNVMLTAAHCLQQSWVLYSVRSGSDYSNKGGTVHQIDRILVHKNYHTNSKSVPRNDIGLVWTVEPFNISETAVNRVVQLYNSGENVTVGDIGVVTGWGRTKFGPAHKLQIVAVPTVSKEYCNSAYLEYGGLPDNQICAGYPEGAKDSCQGDSGGPFAVNGRLAGIVSWGKGCGLRGYPGVYTEVAAYRNWIKENSGI